MDLFINFLIVGLTTGAVYAVMALGFCLIYKASSIFNFAHGDIVALGAFILWTLLVQFGLPLWLAVICLVIIAYILAVVIERFALRPLIGQPVLSAIMVTIGLGQIVAGVVILLWPGLGRSYPDIIPSGKISITQGATVSYEALINFIVCLVAFGIFSIFFRRTRIGLAMRGVAEDHQLARSGGIRVTSIFTIVWFIAILVAFLGGVLMGNHHGVNRAPIASLGLKAFPAVIIGGLESVPGALIGGLLVGLLEAVGAGYLDPFVGGGMTEVLPYVILLLVLMVKPYGMFGYEKIERV